MVTPMHSVQTALLFVQQTEMAVSKQLSPAKYTLLDSTKLHSVAMLTNKMVLDLHSIMSHNSEYSYILDYKTVAVNTFW